jgi:signal transduction histidine kinase
MNLQKKIFIAFLVMILTPCTVLGGIGILAMGIGLHGFRSGGIGTLAIITQPVHALTQLTQSEYNELSTTVARYPERLENQKWIEKMNATLMTKFSYLVVEKNGTELFVGDEEAFEKVRTSVHTAIETKSASFDGAVYVNGNSPVLVKHGNVNYTDGSEGCFLIITEASALFYRMTRSFLIGVGISIIAIGAVAAALFNWLNDSIIHPLENLRFATRQIGQGNLKYSVKREKNDEIGQLCNDFEEMRVHLKTQIDQREQYEQDVREMISNVSHDLKTPLTAIKGYAEGMLDGVADTKEKRDRYLKTIMVRATDMTLLVDELSYYAKLDNNKLPYNFEKVSAVNYFRDCVDEYAIELEMKDFTVKFVSEIDPLTTVSIDCEQIRRVMNNLIGNAVKYRREDVHGQIIVKLTDSWDSVRISVIDNGIGISKEAQPHIFERFYRADKSRTSGRAGTGIGLAIVDKIVKEHKGRVFVKSELGSGTTISFTVKKGAQKKNG